MMAGHLIVNEAAVAPIPINAKNIIVIAIDFLLYRSLFYINVTLEDPSLMLRMASVVEII